MTNTTTAQRPNLDHPLRPIRRLLVANRGEIARRIFRTCQALGVETVAVFSDADANMPFVREADVAVRIGGTSAAESYLRIDALLAAAKQTNADAIHPGYGFLAENAAFQEACVAAGLVFVGPSADSMRAMGLKRESKATVAAAGVPVVPGFAGALPDAETAATEANKIGYPVLVKASAGGGGKGMRVVREAAELWEAIEGARRESLAAFGDDTLILEKYVDTPRHVEIQVLGDAHGNVVHLFERECSIQRRHQKIIEESPSPALNATTREAMGAAAVAAAKAIRYENAGTVEFILAPSGEFYFLEMNTRLQVEHPVTEAVTGLDLVALQLHVAEGGALPFEQSQLQHTGAALECRLYAEDPDAGFLPVTGTVAAWVGREQDGVRVDAGVEAGDTISVHYDPMIAKIITQGATREIARRRMVQALKRMSLAGVTTNRDYLVRVLEHPDYIVGAIDTHFIERHATALSRHTDAAAVGRAAIAATLADVVTRSAQRTRLPAVAIGFRNVVNAPETVTYQAGEVQFTVSYRCRGTAYNVSVTSDDDVLWSGDAAVVCTADGRLTLELDGVRRDYAVVAHTGAGAAGAAMRTISGLDGEFVLRVQPRFPSADVEEVAGACLAPMPGKVIAVSVAEGDEVEVGTPLVVLEAMKMEHTLRATAAGVVAQVRVAVGEQVDADMLLVVVE